MANRSAVRKIDAHCFIEEIRRLNETETQLRFKINRGGMQGRELTNLQDRYRKVTSDKNTLKWALGSVGDIAKEIEQERLQNAEKERARCGIRLSSSTGSLHTGV